MWQAGTLAGSPAQEIAYAFAFVPLLAAVVPWGYAYRTFVRWPRTHATPSLSKAVD